jgi:phenylacetate-CoA ligase
VTALAEIGNWHAWEDLAAEQEEGLRLTLSRAARSPFYQARLRGALPARPADLADVPLTTKQDLRDSYPFGMLAVPEEQLATYHESSGSTGEPTPSYYTEADWLDLAERFARKPIGIRAQDRFLVRTPYAMLLTGHLGQRAARLHGATVIPADNRSLAMPIARVIRVLRDLRVTLTWSIATELLLWARAARAAGLDPSVDFPSLRAFYVGGEPLSRARRDRISHLWHVPVVEEYGSTETGPLSGVCLADVQHLWADRFLPEVYDPETGQCRRAGRGQLVVTPLRREAMPLLRYNLEDTVEVSYDDCPCGWKLPQVKVFGRAAFSYRVSGAEVNQHDLEEVVFRLPPEHDVLFWRGRAEPGVLRLEIEAADEHAAAARDALTSLVRERFGITPVIRAVPMGTLLPREVLTTSPDVVKPRSLFGPDEDWDKAVLYF